MCGTFLFDCGLACTLSVLCAFTPQGTILMVTSEPLGVVKVMGSGGKGASSSPSICARASPKVASEATAGGVITSNDGDSCSKNVDTPPSIPSLVVHWHRATFGETPRAMPHEAPAPKTPVVTARPREERSGGVLHTLAILVHNTIGFLGNFRLSRLAIVVVLTLLVNYRPVDKSRSRVKVD